MFINPKHEKAHNTLKSGNAEEAVRLYTAALLSHPDHPDILSDRGVAYLHLNDREKCMRDLNRALELQPDYSYRYASRAFARNNFGDLDGAIADYRKAIELDPDDAVAHNNLGLLLEQKGYKHEAEQRFERADKLSKQENRLLGLLDEIEVDKAEKDVKKKAVSSSEGAIEKEEQSGAKEFKKIFTSTSQFREFIRFIKNGFKLK